jgi:phosphatidylserine/phosphatidylglycerophosphate/cardiolipin synthase-like enzyme
LAKQSRLPSLEVQLFLHIGREQRDTRYDSEILREFAEDFGRHWPWSPRPRVFYDPRSLALDDAIRATWHAKCVVIDDEVAFVTSANFTEWAQSRNVEAGVLIRNTPFACQLRQQFQSLVQSRAVIEVPGLRQ